jgi:hypothetical protein
MGMVEKMHKPTSDRIIVAPTWSNVGMKHPEQNIIKGKEICSLSRFAPGTIETLDLPLVVLCGVKMQAGTSRSMNTIEPIAQELLEASDGRALPHFT